MKPAVSLHYKEIKKQVKNLTKQEQIFIEASMIRNKSKFLINLKVHFSAETLRTAKTERAQSFAATARLKSFAEPESRPQAFNDMMMQENE